MDFLYALFPFHKDLMYRYPPRNYPPGPAWSLVRMFYMKGRGYTFRSACTLLGVVFVDHLWGTFSQIVYGKSGRASRAPNLDRLFGDLEPETTRTLGLHLVILRY